MDKAPRSEEIQNILSESDLWDSGLSEVGIAESYSAKRWRWTTQYIRQTGWIKMLGLALIPPAIGGLLGFSTDSLLNGLAAGGIVLLVEILLIYLFYAPKEMYESLRSDLVATQNQLTEEKRKLIRIATIAKENEGKYLESSKDAVQLMQRELEEQKRVVAEYKEQRHTLQTQVLSLQIDQAALKKNVESLELSNRELLSRFVPELEIVYEAEGEHFTQKYNGAKQYRVAVVSPTAMDDAELVANQVTLSSIDNPLVSRHSRLHLRPMHDRNPAGTKRVKIKPFEREFWDVVSEVDGVVCLNHIVSPLNEQELAPGTHEFELRVTGGQKPAATAIVTLQISAKGDRVERFEVREGRLSEASARGLVW